MLVFPREGFNFNPMIALATDPLSLDNLTLGWFDFVFVAFLVVGFFRGRKNGLSKELVPTLRWVAIILAGAFGYQFVAQIFYNFFGFGRATTECFGYLAVAFVVMLVFVPLDALVTPRLAAANAHGGVEYYLGTVAGLIRYLCIVLFVLAFMNAPYYSAAEIQAEKDFAFKTYGGGQKGFNGDFFPTFQQVQQGVFRESKVGQLISDHLGMILINGTPADAAKTPAKP
jgi:uncharacterized membrane protein required for colicin V production